MLGKGGLIEHTQGYHARRVRDDEQLRIQSTGRKLGRVNILLHTYLMGSMDPTDFQLKKGQILLPPDLGSLLAPFLLLSLFHSFSLSLLHSF